MHYQSNLSGYIRPLLLATLAAVVLLAPVMSFAQEKGMKSEQAKTPTLYQRLGGYDALAAVVDDFIGRLATHPDLGGFFKGHNSASLKRIRQLVVDQLCEATGGPCYYTGADMKHAHAGLGISEADWNTSVELLVATLDKFKVPQKEKEEVLGAISTMKNDIVEQTAMMTDQPK